MNENPSFNLIDEPWIDVRWPDGRVSTESLTTVFAHANEITQIAGELPTQAFAIFRILLAILQRAILTAADFDEDEEPADVWGGFWSSSDLPLSDITAYLERWHDRFFLFGGDAPFMQVPGLHTPRHEVSPVGKIVAEVPDGHPFFTTRSGPSSTTLSTAEAARWLIHVHAYDTAGIKSGVVGDTEVKGGKSYPIGPGWTGRLGGVQVEGDRLTSTLLLNLRLGLADEPTQWVSGDDLPAWERAGEQVGDAKRQPGGQADLYTWQSRRVRLVLADNAVTGVVLTNGDKLKPHNQFKLEPLSGWRRSANQEKALKEAMVYLPFRVEAGRALWRGLDALLPTVGSTRVDGQPYLCPGILDWLSYLVSDNGGGVLSDDHVLKLRSTGVVYGPQESTFADVVSDTLLVSSALLTPAGAPLVELAKSCVADTFEAVRHFGYLARNLYLAEGGDSQTTDGPRNQATSAAYYSIDIAFRRWLADLEPVSGDEDAQQDHAILAREAWRRAARTILTRLSDDLLAQASPQAFTGHATNDARAPWMTSSVAARIFSSALRRTLPLTTDTDPIATQGKE
jgi:CRISPR system Cascade subunit CasA|nr:type I-E CRISPR-associated protein Cse1/CasA [Propionibacteriaceae bacterium]